MFPFVAAARCRFLVILLFLPCVDLFRAAAALAEESAEVVGERIVVTATRLPTPAADIGSSVTVITQEEIAARQQRTLPDVLNDVPGLNVVQAGGPGGTTSVFMRGTNANHTKVLLDGVDISDPSSADGSFDFAHILAADIDHVEILRGPQSGLYGSDAIGGVINVITKKGEGPPKFAGAIEGGSFATFNQTAAARGSIDRFNYAFDFEHFHAGATPVTPLALLPPGRARNDDSYGNRTFGTKLGADLTDNLDVGLVARYIDTNLRATGDDLSTFPSTPAAAQSESDTQQLFTRATVHQKLFDGAADQTLGLNVTNFRRQDYSPDAAPTFNRGRRLKIDWQGSAELLTGETALIGAEAQRDEIIESPISAHTDNYAGFAELQSSIGDRFFNAASLRFDDNDRFGPALTFRVAPALLFPETGTKLKASIGSGFKGPSLNQLFVSFPAFNFFANPNLKPEKSLGHDVGFEQAVTSWHLSFGSTYFHNDIRNLIALNAAGNADANIARAETYGVESFIDYAPISDLDLRLDHTFTIANDSVLHQELLRRPKHKLSITAAWQVTKALSLNPSLLYVGPWIDGNRDFSVPRLKTTGYTIVDLAASYAATENVTFCARIDNLLDRRYEEPVGFQRPGLGFFAGFRISYDVAASGK